MTKNVDMIIPDKYLAGLAADKLVITNGVLRDASNMRIVEHLNFVSPCNSAVKNVLMIGGTVIVAEICVSAGKKIFRAIKESKEQKRQYELLMKSFEDYYGDISNNCLKQGTVTNFRRNIQAYPNVMNSLIDNEMGEDRGVFSLWVQNITREVADDTGFGDFLNYTDRTKHILDETDSSIDNVVINLLYQELFIRNAA